MHANDDLEVNNYGGKNVKGAPGICLDEGPGSMFDITCLNQDLEKKLGYN